MLFQFLILWHQNHSGSSSSVSCTLCFILFPTKMEDAFLHLTLHQFDKQCQVICCAEARRAEVLSVEYRGKIL